MTENEAIERIKKESCYSENCHDGCLYGEENCAYSKAISALKEIQHYRKIGTLEELARAKKYINLSKRHGTIGEMIDECAEYESIGNVEEFREAREKQNTKVLEFYGDNEDGKLLCPNCGEDLWELKDCGFSNCPYCGQAIS